MSFDAHLPRFVDPQHVAAQTVLQHLVMEQVRDGLRVLEALLAQDIARLGARREGEDLLAALGFDFFRSFLHEGVLPLPAPPRIIMRLCLDSKT